MLRNDVFKIYRESVLQENPISRYCCHCLIICYKLVRAKV